MHEKLTELMLEGYSFRDAVITIAAARGVGAMGSRRRSLTIWFAARRVQGLWICSNYVALDQVCTYCSDLPLGIIGLRGCVPDRPGGTAGGLCE